MVKRKDIPVDATIRDVLPTLTNADEFVRVVLGHMSECRMQHLNAFVRIGVTGQGKVPSHIIVYDDASDQEHLFKGWSESTPFEEPNFRGDNWSRTRMSWDEVRTLRGETLRINPIR